MSFNGVLVFVISLAVLIAFLPSIKKFCLEGVREWQETDEEEKKQIDRKSTRLNSSHPSL